MPTANKYAIAEKQYKCALGVLYHTELYNGMFTNVHPYRSKSI